MLGLLGGGDGRFGGDADVPARLGGRGRGAAPDAHGGGFSLAWCDDGPGSNDALSRGGGKRIVGPVDIPAKESYAMALKAQIAERDSLRRQRSSSAAPKEAAPGPAGYRGASAVGAAAAREPSPFARLGSAVLDPSSKAAAYARDLRAQIDSRAHAKAELQRQRLESEREENARRGADPAESAQNSKQKELQDQRHQVMAQRADALERFMGARGAGVGGGHALPPAGMRKQAQQQQCDRPPRPEQGDDVQRRGNQSTFSLAW